MRSMRIACFRGRTRMLRMAAQTVSTEYSSMNFLDDVLGLIHVLDIRFEDQ